MAPLLRPPVSATAIIAAFPANFPELAVAVDLNSIPIRLTASLLDELKAVETVSTTFPRQLRQAIIAWVTRLRNRACREL
jgi:hypothetical protein